MRFWAIIFTISLLSLTACEKDFDEKYQDNLNELNQEAQEIKSGVDQQLSQGREADQIMKKNSDIEKPAHQKDETAQ